MSSRSSSLVPFTLILIHSILAYIQVFRSVLVNAPLPLQVGGNWVELPAGQYTLPSNRQTYCQIEAHARYNALISHAPEGEARGQQGATEGVGSRALLGLRGEGEGRAAGAGTAKETLEEGRTVLLCSRHASGALVSHIIPYQSAYCLTAAEEGQGINFSSQQLLRTPTICCVHPLLDFPAWGTESPAPPWPPLPPPCPSSTLGDWALLAPLRVLSIDIECAGRKVQGEGGERRGGKVVSGTVWWVSGVSAV